MLFLNLLFITFLLFMNGFFVAAEFAFVGVRKTRIQQLTDEGNFDAKLALDAVNNIDRYIAAVQLGITISSLALGWVGEETIVKLIKPLFAFLPSSVDTIAAHTVSVSLAFAFITFMHVVIGELMPKSIALQFPEKTTLFVAKPMYLVTKIFAPFILLLNGFGNFLLRLLRIEPANSHHMVHTTEELNMLIDASCKGGVLKEEEAEILQNVFKFSDLDAEQVMVPRTEMVCISIDSTVEEINEIIIENNYTRYPVYKNDIDHILGFIHIKDVYPNVVKRIDFEISSILRAIEIIPETMPIEHLAQDFKQNKSQIAIVVDEFGGTSGLITHEDILEEILGEVQDEFDEDEEIEAEKLTDNVFEVNGKMRLDEFCEYFDVKLDDDDVTTIGGYFIKKLGKIAEVDDKVEDEYFTYSVVKMESTRIVQLKVERNVKA